MKNIPKRTCIGCNTQKEKRELIRVVKNNKNEFSIDKTGKAEGRGAYICNSVDCFEKAIKNKKLEKTFKMSIDSEVYENLRGVIIGK